MLLAFPEGHTFIFHTDLITVCGVCEVEAKCVRFAQDDSDEVKDICSPCIREGLVPDGFTVMAWCTECVATIPRELQPDLFGSRELRGD